jgi:hypothetical protein
MRPHDNQIHSLLARCVHNRLRGGSLDEEALSLEPSTLDPLSTRLQEVLRIGLQVVQIGGSHPGSHLSHGHRGQVQDMEQCEPSLELLSQGNGIFQCSVGSGTEVDRDEHVLNDHRGLLACTEAGGQRFGTFLLLYPLRDAKTILPDARGLHGGEDRGGKIQSHTWARTSYSHSIDRGDTWLPGFNIKISITDQNNPGAHAVHLEKRCVGTPL